MPFEGSPEHYAPVVAPTKFALPDLILWLEKRPADMHYEYGDCRLCALAKFAADIGHKYDFVAACRQHLHGIGDGALWQMETIADGFPRTYGAMLDRARAALVAS